MAEIDEELAKEKMAGRKGFGIDPRFGKYDLIEVDGIFGLISGLDRRIGEGGYRVFPVNLDKERNIFKVGSDGKSMYGDYLITKYKVPFGEDRCYLPDGDTHYLGKRMSLAEYEMASEADFLEAWNAFRLANPEMGSNYENSMVGKFEGLMEASDQFVIKAGEKIDELKRKGREIDIDSIDGVFPGFKTAYERVEGKANAWIAKADKSMDAFFEKVEDGDLEKTLAEKLKEAKNRVVGLKEKVRGEKELD